MKVNNMLVLAIVFAIVVLFASVTISFTGEKCPENQTAYTVTYASGQIETICR